MTDIEAVPTVMVENDRVRVTEWRFAPGAATGHHFHEYDYIVVPMTAGTLRMFEPEGTRDAVLVAGTAYHRPRGVAHDAVNIGGDECVFIEVELLENG